MCFSFIKIISGREKLLSGGPGAVGCKSGAGRVEALEEWRVEALVRGGGPTIPRVADQWNLEYLKNANRLNARQARWGLFFSRFNFTLSYRPGSKNTKPDALSRIHAPETDSSDPEPILPQTFIVGAFTWSVEGKVIEALRANPAPPELLCGLMRVRSPVILAPASVCI